MDDYEILTILLSVMAIAVSAIGICLAQRRKKRKAQSKIIKVILDLDEKKKIVDVTVKWEGQTDYEVVHKGDEVTIKPKKK